MTGIIAKKNSFWSRFNPFARGSNNAPSAQQNATPSEPRNFDVKGKASKAFRIAAGCWIGTEFIMACMYGPSPWDVPAQTGIRLAYDVKTVASAIGHVLTGQNASHVFSDASWPTRVLVCQPKAPAEAERQAVGS